MNKQTILLTLAALLLVPLASDARTVAINVRPEQTNSVCVEHVQYTPLTLEMTVLGVVSTSATLVVRNASNVVVIATNATCSGDTYTAVTSAGNWTDDTTGVLAPGDEPAQLWADLHLAGYGVPLRPIDIRVRYAAATGTETYVDPVTGAWTIGGTNRTDIQRVVVPAGSTVAAGVLTLASVTTNAVTNGFHGGMSGTGSVTRVGNRLRIIMPAPGTTTNALTLEGHPAAYFRPAGQIENHAGASNLAWTASGHTGTPARIAGFLEGGSAGYIGFGPGLYLDGSDNIAVSNAVLNGAAQFGLWLASPTLPASAITNATWISDWLSKWGNTNHWNSAYGWGDHGTNNYLKSFTELDPVFGLWLASPTLPHTAITNAPWLTAVSVSTGLTGNGTPSNPLVATGGGVTNHQDLSNIPGDAEGYHLSAANAARAAAAITNGPVINIDTAILSDPFSGGYRVNWSTGTLYTDPAFAPVVSFDWVNRIAYADDGTTPMINWSNAASLSNSIAARLSANLTAWAAITPASKQDALGTGSVTSTMLSNTTVTAGNATNGTMSVDADGRITSMASGSPTNVITVVANSPGTNTVTLSWYTSTQIRMLATNSGSIVKIDYPAPPTGRAAFLAYSLANPNSKSVTYSDQGNVYWASNGVFTTTARAMGKYGRVSVANLGASKYEACLIATNSVEIGYP